jgi:RHS repeat-associated protein
VTQRWLWQGQLSPIAELNASNAVVSRFVYATRVNVPDYMIKGGVTYRILHDHLGSPRLVVNTSTGAIAQRMDFDEWGIVTTDTNPGWQPFGFAGGIRELGGEATRFGARDYFAPAGRWATKDPVRFRAGLTGLYSYVGDDPLNLYDPSGLSACSSFVDHLLDIAAAVHRSQIGRVFLLEAQALGNSGIQLATDGFRPELVANNQGGDVYRHVYGHAGGVLDQLGIGAAMAGIAEWKDRRQLSKDPGRLETLAELAGNEAGREVGRALESLYGDEGHLGEGSDITGVKEKLLDILCGPEETCQQ